MSFESPLLWAIFLGSIFTVGRSRSKGLGEVELKLLSTFPSGPTDVLSGRITGLGTIMFPDLSGNFGRGRVKKCSLPLSFTVLLQRSDLEGMSSISLGLLEVSLFLSEVGTPPISMGILGVVVSSLSLVTSTPPSSIGILGVVSSLSPEIGVSVTSIDPLGSEVCPSLSRSLPSFFSELPFEFSSFIPGEGRTGMWIPESIFLSSSILIGKSMFSSKNCF